MILEAHGPKFTLMRGLDPEKYIMTNSLRDADNWRAYTYAGESSEGRMQGDMGEVGYVCISLKDNSIIPIARGDEHHQGMDLLYDLAEGVRFNARGKKIKTAPLDFNPSDYYPIFALGNNYAYEGDQSKMVIAVKKFLSYGGKDRTIKGMGIPSQVMHLSDFVGAKGLAKIEHGKLAVIGEKIVNGFTNLANAIRNASDQSRVSTVAIFKQAVDLIKLLHSVNYELGVRFDDTPDKIRELQKTNDLTGLEELFFSFNGVKNSLHAELKKMVAEASRWNEDRINALWGDPELAIDMLGRI